MAEVWYTIFHRFNITSKKFQPIDIDISIAVELYTSQTLCVKNELDIFDFF